MEAQHHGEADPRRRPGAPRQPQHADAAQDAAYRLYKQPGPGYAKRVRVEAAKYSEAHALGAHAGGTGGGGAGAAGDEEVIML